MYPLMCRCSGQWLGGRCSRGSTSCSSWFFFDSLLPLRLPWGSVWRDTSQSAFWDVVSEPELLHHANIRLPQRRNLPRPCVPGQGEVSGHHWVQKLLFKNRGPEALWQWCVCVPLHHWPPCEKAARPEGIRFTSQRYNWSDISVKNCFLFHPKYPWFAWNLLLWFCTVVYSHLTSLHE